MSLSVVLVVHDLSIGAVARAQALTEVLAVGGHRTRTLAVRGDHLWAPVRGTAYASTCARVDADELSAVIASGTDLVIAVKTLPSSLGLARSLARRHGVPLVADVDDPDVEVRTTWRPLREVARLAADDPRRFLRLRSLRRLARRLPSTASNPVLQQIYGGELVPHARVDHGAGRPHTSEQPTLAFIGTVRAHKGIDLLRSAVQRLAPEGWRLLVTAEPPVDARPWEDWVGSAPADTRALLAASDVVVIPSQPAGAGGYDYGRAQLPLKLVDAMLAGRAVVVSDYGPLAWAAGTAAPVFPAGDVEGLVRALRPLRDPALRQRIGAALRADALARFTPEAVAPALARAARRAGADLGGATVGARRGALNPGPADAEGRGVSAAGHDAEPSVSVVIPVRDGAATIAQQLDALAAQRTSRSFEVVVADNGSTDGTADLVREHQRGMPALRLVDASATIGTNAARNAGTRAARGELVLLCDADDVVDPGWVEALAAALETADAAGGPLERTSLSHGYVRAWGPPPPNPGIYVHLGFLPRPTGANAGFRREVWEALGGFDERYVRGGTETEFFWRLQLAGHTLVEAPDALVHYRLRGSTRAILRQQYTWGRQTPMLYRDFRAHGLRWRPLRAAGEWLTTLSLVPRAAWGPRGKKLGAARQIALRAGMVVGSVQHRSLWL